MISFVVPGIPVAQPRQRHAIIAGHVRNFTPANSPVTAFKAACKIAARQAYDGPPMEDALAVRLTFVFPRLKSTRGNLRTPKITKPDADNLAKSVMDALNGQVWRDDSIIADLFCSKRLAHPQEQPCVEVRVETLA